jgi:hypothetical protein
MKRHLKILMLTCVLQFNLLILMLDWLIEQRDAVTLALSTVSEPKNSTAQQWTTANELVDTLRPFIDITQQMSTAAKPTL